MFLGFSPIILSGLGGMDLSDLVFLGEVGGTCAEKAEWNMPVNHQHLPQVRGASDYIEGGNCLPLVYVVKFLKVFGNIYQPRTCLPI